jgi:hypothetical protein
VPGVATFEGRPGGGGAGRVFAGNLSEHEQVLPAADTKRPAPHLAKRILFSGQIPVGGFPFGDPASGTRSPPQPVSMFMMKVRRV